MKILSLRALLVRYVDMLCGRGASRPYGENDNQRLTLLLQVTQWHIEGLTEEEYLHWL